MASNVNGANQTLLQSNPTNFQHLLHFVPNYTQQLLPQLEAGEHEAFQDYGKDVNEKESNDKENQ